MQIMDKNIKHPNFFIVGTAKSGTSALHKYLKEHKEVFMTDIKEPEFFAEDFPKVRIVETEEEYLKLFSRAEPKIHKILGESSVLYMYSEVAIKKIKIKYPDAKLLVILRNPIDLMYSSYSQLRYGGGETANSFEEAWNLQSERKKGKQIPVLNRDPKILQYKDFAMLGRQVNRIYQHFPREQVLVLFHDDFIVDKGATYRKVLGFLGVQDDKRSNFNLVNTNKNIKNMPLHILLTALLNTQARLKVFIPKKMQKLLKKVNIVHHVRCMNIDYDSNRTQLSKDFKGNIIQYFIDDIQILENLTGRDLSHWKNLGE